MKKSKTKFEFAMRVAMSHHCRVKTHDLILEICHRITPGKQKFHGNNKEVRECNRRIVRNYIDTIGYIFQNTPAKHKTDWREKIAPGGWINSMRP